MNLNDDKSWKQLVLAAFAIVAIVAFFWLLWTIHGVLLPLFFACFLAYLLNPLVQKLEKWRVNRTIGALLAVLISAAVLVLMALIPWPIISSQLQLVHEQLPNMVAWVRGTLLQSAWLAKILPHQPDVGWLSQLQSLISENVNMSTLGQKAWEYTRQGGSVVLSVVSWVVLMPVLTYFILADWPRLIQSWRRLLPKRWRMTAWKITHAVDEALEQYVRGLVLLILSLATYYAVSLSIIGLNMGIAVGILTGMFVVVPYLGFGTGLVLASLAGFLQFGLNWHFFAVLAVYGVGQLLEGYVLTPRLVGERIGLSPVAVIIALLIFGTLFGLVGMLFALPVSAVLVVLSHFAREAYENSAFYQQEHR